jgi:enamine deaminase RidA (YjgF/YER057c/UK114 family)
MTMAEIVKVKSNSAIEGRSSYSRAIVIDNWIVVANTAGRDFKDRTMPAGAGEQAAKSLDNIAGALAAVGSGLADVVRARVSVPDPADMPAVMAVFAERFRGIEPTGTFTCTPLAGPDYRVEIEVTAYRGAGARTEKRVSVVL